MFDSYKMCANLSQYSFEINQFIDFFEFSRKKIEIKLHSNKAIKSNKTITLVQVFYDSKC